MKRVNVVQSNSQLSILLDAVEFTLCGVPVARLVQPERRNAPRFELATFLAKIRQQPPHAEEGAGELVSVPRKEARYCNSFIWTRWLRWQAWSMNQEQPPLTDFWRGQWNAHGGSPAG